MNPTLQWALGAVGGCVVFMGGLMAWLLKVAYSIGQSAKGIEELRGDLIEMKGRTDRVPVLETKADQLGEMLETHIRKTDSDFRELRRTVFGQSRPDLNGGHE